MATVNPPRGMRDFLPAEKRRREQVLAMIRDRYEAHGFDEIETPVMEDYARLHGGLGGDNEKLAFTVMKRALTAEKLRSAADPADLADLGLRFDLTVPLSRFYTSHRGDLPGVFRAIQIAPVWRAERPQKGRYRQFVQCDIDIIGDATPRAEAELLAASLDAFATLGLRDVTIRINDRRALDAMLDVFGFPVADRPGTLITIDKLDKIGPSGVAAELRERGSADEAVTALEEFLEGLAEPTEPYGAEQIRALLPQGIPEDVVDHLVGIGDAVGRSTALRFDPFLVRGMGYYTGTIFEVEHPDVSYSLGGGGRYDGMIGRFLGQDVPAVGFSIGFERILDLIELDPAAGGDAVVLVHDKDVPVAELLAHKEALVASGARVRLEQRPRNLKGVLERAVADGYTVFATLSRGQDELELKSLAEPRA